MKNIDFIKLSKQSVILFVVGIMILIGQRIGYGVSVVPAIPGMILIVLVCIFALFMRALTPKLQFPAFAYASLTALILSMPFMPTSEIFLGLTDHINFLGTTTAILAFAGISVGNKILQLKKLSWKVAIVSILVFTGTFFGSAIVANIILKAQGII